MAGPERPASPPSTSNLLFGAGKERLSGADTEHDSEEMHDAPTQLVSDRTWPRIPPALAGITTTDHARPETTDDLEGEDASLIVLQRNVFAAERMPFKPAPPKVRAMPAPTLELEVEPAIIPQAVPQDNQRRVVLFSVLLALALGAMVIAMGILVRLALTA